MHKKYAATFFLRHILKFSRFSAIFVTNFSAVQQTEELCPDVKM